MRAFLCLQALSFLLGIGGGAAYAEWVPIDETYQSPGLRTVYIEPASIRREANLSTISVLIDWRSMQGGRSPTRFYSTTFTKQFDCSEKRVRLLAATDFYGHMGSSEPIGGSVATTESHWRDVEPKSLDQGLMEAACRKE